MDLLAHIKKEHAKFRGKIAQIESSTGERKRDIFRELYAEIHGHHEAEETVVFPKVKDEESKEAKEVVLEMIEEHELGSYQFCVLEKTAITNETWDAKFKVLKEVLDHHMKEEEEEFLPLAKKAIPEEKMDEILAKFEAFHEEKEKEMKEKLG